MKWTLFVGALMLSISAVAQTMGSSSLQTRVKTRAPSPTRVEIYPLNYQTRFERNEDQYLQGRSSALNFGLGVSRGRLAALLEVSSSSVTSDSGIIQIKREHREVLVWLRRDLERWQSVLFQGGLGAGSSQDLVTTRLAGDEVKDSGRWDALGAASLGVAWDIKKTLRLSLEGRLFFGSNMDPNPQPDLLLRTGFLF